MKMILILIIYYNQITGQVHHVAIVLEMIIVANILTICIAVLSLNEPPFDNHLRLPIGSVNS
jgi:hypothetical protein